ncbi:MAG TPA: 16S rRNA (adenine(1518)-N(6)/adenine(1519)-N(6))-dimethyltransferase RsmA [Candidatus Binatia bacterium]
MGARWGQCFLVDHDAARRIVEWAAIDGRDVVEIGPGRGALTELLRERSRSLAMIEIDPRLAAELEQKYRGDPAVTVVHADALRVDWSTIAAPGFTVVANLPYETGTAIVASLLERRHLVRELVVMLQKEVVARLGAAAGNKTYGGLSVLVQMLAEVERGMVLAPRSFRPRPAVESQMVRIRPLARPRFDLGDEAELEFVVRSAFAHRRKMLRNNLGAAVDARFGAGAAEDVMARAEIAGDSRPEQLGLEQFAALVRAVVRRRDAEPPAQPADPDRIRPVRHA